MKKDFWKGKKPLFFLALYISDVACFFLSNLFIFLLLGDFNPLVVDFFERVILFSILILVVNYSAFSLYDEKRKLFDDSQVMSIFYSMAITYAIMLTFLLLFGLSFMIKYISLGYVTSFVFTILFRIILFQTIYYFRKTGHDMKKVLFFGKENQELVNRIKEDASLGYKLIGQTSSIEELKKSLQKVDVVFVLEEKINDKLMELIMENSDVDWKIVPGAFNLIMDKVDFDEFKDYPIININASDSKNNYLKIKRVMDILLPGIAMIVLSPLFLVIVIIMKLTMPGPIFYKHERLGKDLKPFMLYKFRTMVIDADKIKPYDNNEVKALFKMRKDPRVTKFGHFLRRTALDELPQLINILKGEMSIVGPRPHLREELHYYKGWRKLRFEVQPGLTGMWQVSGRHELNFDKAVLYDIYYIKHMSLPLDISIIIRTIPALVFTKGRY